MVQGRRYVPLVSCMLGLPGNVFMVTAGGTVSESVTHSFVQKGGECTADDPCAFRPRSSPPPIASILIS